MGKHQVRQPDSLQPKAVFLDRDGVINQVLLRGGKPYPPTSLSDLKILPDVPEACQELKEAGYLLILATNQPDVGRGTLDQSIVEEIHNHLQSILPLDRIEVCFDPGNAQANPSRRSEAKADQTNSATTATDPKFDPQNRKPAPGMLLRSAKALNIDLARSFMVGDRWRDIDCGKAAGCTTIFIDYGYKEDLRAAPDHVVKNLSEAARIILDRVDPLRVQ